MDKFLFDKWDHEVVHRDLRPFPRFTKIVRVRGAGCGVIFCCVFSGHFPGKTVFIVRKSVFIVKRIPVITQRNLGTDWQFS